MPPRQITEPARAVDVILETDVRNLLVAGRSTGGDRVSHAATRNMSCCAVTGQGAGVAAAVSIKSGKSLREIDLALAQSELKRQGVRIH